MFSITEWARRYSTGNIHHLGTNIPWLVRQEKPRQRRVNHDSKKREREEKEKKNITGIEIMNIANDNNDNNDITIIIIAIIIIENNNFW